MILGVGELLFIHKNGWSCTKEAALVLEFDVRPDKTARKTMVVEFKNLYNVDGEIIPKELTQGIFKYENGKKVAFNAVIAGNGRLEVEGETNNDFETILNKISQWQEQFKVN